MARTPAKKKIHKPSTGLTIIKPRIYSLANPQDISDFGKILRSFVTANKLSIVIKTRQGPEEYCLVDGWKFLGQNFQMTAIPSMPQARHVKGEYVTTLYAMRQYFDNKGKPTYKKESPVFVGYAEHKDMINAMVKRHSVVREFTRPFYSYENEAIIKHLVTGKEIMRGTGTCSNLEIKKAEFDDFQVRSMCETRSVAKTYRNLLGHVMKGAGYNPTPAEEVMDNDHDQFQDADVQSSSHLPELDEDMYAKAYDKIRMGEWDVEHVKKGYTLSEKQEASLKVVEEKLRKKNV